MLLPFATGISVSILLGRIIIFSSFEYLVYSFPAQGPEAFLWRVLIGIIYVVRGFYLAIRGRPVQRGHFAAGVNPLLETLSGRTLCWGQSPVKRLCVRVTAGRIGFQDFLRGADYSERIYCLKKIVNLGTRVSCSPPHRTATLRERAHLKNPKRNARSCKTIAARPRSPSGHFQTARPRSLPPCDCPPRFRLA